MPRPLIRVADRPLLVPRFIRLLTPRWGLLERSRLGIVGAVRFLRKVVRRIVGVVLTCADYEGEGTECGEFNECFHREIRCEFQ
jgi:hypothetical protein